MVKLEFYDPSGIIKTELSHAPRLETLTGKRIGLLSNGQWQAYRMLPQIKAWLEDDYRDIEVLPPETYPQGSAFIGTEETARLVEESGVDAVIIGNAA